MTSSTLSSVQDARSRIDEINARVVELLAERQAVVDEICDVKAEADEDIRDPEREAELLDHVRSVAADAGLSPDLAETLFEEILDHSVQHQRRRREADAPSEANGSAGTEGVETSADAPDAWSRNGAPSPNGHGTPMPASRAEAATRPDGASADRSYYRVTREHRADDTIVHVDDVAIGDGSPILIAGPCSVESRDQILRSAEAVVEAGGHLLRGGCFKPRTSPYSFQGLGEAGLDLLAEAGRRFDVPVITEVLAPGDVAAVAARADVLQIGARNMQNFPLLKAVGAAERPVMLKRGMMASIDEWLSAAEYVVAHGSPNVFLCERGIQTFESTTRYTLDLSSVPVVQERTHLPVVVDPSHACGTRRWVPPLVRAAVAARADGVMVEAHPNPQEALSDGPQSLPLDALPRLGKLF